MVLGISERWRGEPTNFEAHIMSGRKWHSIRLGTRWSEGRRIQFATGVRTKAYRCFHEDDCMRTQGVKIIPSVPKPGKPDSFLPRVLVERGPMRVLMPLHPFELMAFAINDGFDSAYDLNRWVADVCRQRRAPAFRGQVVMWCPVGIEPLTYPTPY